MTLMNELIIEEFEYVDEMKQFIREHMLKREMDLMKKMYNHAMLALCDTGHGEGFDEYCKNNNI